MTQKEIDKIRDGAVNMRVGNDETRCLVMIGISDAMYVVKEQSIWKIQLADAIDPSRSNVSLPNAQQQILSIGAHSEIVKKTLLQAHYFLEASLSEKEIDRDYCLSAALALSVAFAKLDETIFRLEKHAEETEATLEPPSMRSLVVPAYADLEREWSNAHDTLSDIRSLLRELSFHFFSEISKKERWFRDLSERLDFSAFLSSDQSEVVSVIEHNLGFVRWFRNAKEHPKPGQKLTLQNYRLLPDGSIATPTVVIEKGDDAPVEIDMASLLRQLRSATMFSTEMIILWLFCSNLRKVFGKNVSIAARDPNSASDSKPPHVYTVEFEGRDMIIG